MSNQKNNTSKRANTPVTTTTIHSNVKVANMESQHVVSTSQVVDTYTDNSSASSIPPVKTETIPNIDNTKSETDSNAGDNHEPVEEPDVVGVVSKPTENDVTITTPSHDVTENKVEPNIDNTKSETDSNAGDNHEPVEEPDVVGVVSKPTENDVTITTPSHDVTENKVEPMAVTDDNLIKVGVKVKLKESTMTTVTGQKIPAFAYKNEYRVSKVIPCRIIISAGTLTFAVKATDIVVL